VRDHLLGRERGEVDVDVVVDDLCGAEFAGYVARYVRESGCGAEVKVAVISENAEKSKHLETATMRVCGLSVDVVNLRSERYTECSRIPEVEIGTPLEDAERRDLTINALFYNINTRCVEDFTGKGLADLRDAVIRTPLPPLTTLLDDPLRVLRAVRFTSRLDFTLCPNLLSAACDPAVHAALATKVSRERVSTEVDAMLREQNPDRVVRALGLLVEMGLYPAIFPGPSTYAHPPDIHAEAALGSVVNLELMLAHHFDGVAQHSKEDTRLARYAAFFAPVADATYSGKKGRTEPLVRHLMGVDLRVRVRDVDAVVQIHAAARHFARLAADPVLRTRLAAARVLRQIGPRWKIALQVALLAEIEPSPKLPTYRVPVAHALPCRELGEEGGGAEAEAARRFAGLQREIEGMGLEGVWDLKAMVDGKDLPACLPRIKKGPEMGKVLEREIEWMIENPDCGRDECERWLKEEFEQWA